MSTDTKIIGGVILATVVIVIGGVFLLSKQESGDKSVPDDQIVSRNGLHWHPELSIYIKGKKQEIPKDIGIGAIHQSIHTHDSSGVIHMEMQGLITKDDTKLDKFFTIWGKQFNSKCIFDSCNSSSSSVKMFVNSKENKDFENYLMKDKDSIEIRYE